MNRDAKTQSALIALARSRRMQRALSHAYLHRNAPMPTLRSSLSYMTQTACVTQDATAIAHRMTLLGIARNEGVAYVVEEIGANETPIVYRLWLRGPRQGYLVPMHSWYEHCDDASEIRAKIAALAPRLEMPVTTPHEAWMLSTRIVQRRALRLATGTACGDLPIRKFALQLAIEPVNGNGPSGKTTVTAFLRPQAQLVEAWVLPGGEAAIARVSFTGIPSGVGFDKETMVLLTQGLYGLDDPDAV
ncbi:MAG: hypothetical protein H0T42_12620 [Deltaproteobacteria bacterium]|nr:hypothetical protein [Deltaproteobacteria bacterium]